jgi:hypothetical protein|uniref:Uncharacterized protein n=1 Tax=Picea glauca TaxID=3330 RepID=A0A117NI76_PICGL|nr:hypothetical protein ABT39_MTgene2762 [Picea glauca]QHR89664.1 hypothetical protein Q903MT_gene3686 [Picea sitchensis]
MVPCVVPVAGQRSKKNKPKGEKAPIQDVPNPILSEQVLDPRVHIPADEHLKGYVEQVLLTDYDIHNYAAFPEFAPEKY